MGILLKTGGPTTMLFRFKQHAVLYSNDEAPAQPETPEFDEDGRKYVFRYPKSSGQSYTIDRERIFEYLATHEVPGARARRIRRDLANAANFYEDVREIQTHPDVVPLDEVRRRRFRSVS
jgi:hypothetical protein